MTQFPSDSDAPGWDAIDAAVDAVYPGQEPLHFGNRVRYRDGGPDPLDGISIYRAGGEQPHWHYVSLGLSDIWGLADVWPDDADLEGLSGFGHELTFRLADPDVMTAAEAPPWPLKMLQDLARYALAKGASFAPGHRVTTPVASTGLGGLVFLPDPTLPAQHHPQVGRLSFLQLVAVRPDELEFAKEHGSDAFLKRLREVSPLAVTDPERPSLVP